MQPASSPRLDISDCFVNDSSFLTDYGQSQDDPKSPESESQSSSGYAGSAAQQSPARSAAQQSPAGSAAQQSPTLTSVHLQPGWLDDLLANFKEQIIDQCSARTRTAVENNKYLEVVTIFD